MGKAVLGEDASTKNQLAAMAADTPEMKAAAAAYARRVLLKQQILLRVYEPLAKLVGVSKEYFEHDFAAELAEKIADIPDEFVTTPSPSVALPAMEGLARSLEEPNLKEMYLNLLAAGTDGRRKDDAHPSFAEIIKQLSAEEAGLLADALRLSPSGTPVVRMRAKNIGSPTGRGKNIGRHIVNWRDNGSREPANPHMGPVYVDNWVRLGLVHVSYEYDVAMPHVYDWAKNDPLVVQLRRRYRSWRTYIAVTRGRMDITDFGARFGAAVLERRTEKQ